MFENKPFKYSIIIYFVTKCYKTKTSPSSPYKYNFFYFLKLLTKKDCRTMKTNWINNTTPYVNGLLVVRVTLRNSV